MVKVIKKGVYYMEGRIVKEVHAFMTSDKREKAAKRTLTYSILEAHHLGGNRLRIDCTVFDALPRHLSTVERYVCETTAGCGNTILCMDKEVRTGALGALAFCAPEPAQENFEVECPELVAVYLRGKPRKGVGPIDVALALQKALAKGFAKDKILEFIGPGLSNLSMEYRMSIDFASAKTGCLSTVWETDEKTLEFLCVHGREGDHRKLTVEQPAYYDGAVTVDLSRIEPMIGVASGILPLREFLSEGEVTVGEGTIAGSYEDIGETAEIVRDKGIGSAFLLRVHPVSQPVLKAANDAGYTGLLIEAGAVIGAVDGAISLSHVMLGEEVAVMDARSVAATAIRGGVLTSALDSTYNKRLKKYKYSAKIYLSRVSKGN